MAEDLKGWLVARKLGSGGQGDVFLVVHPDRASAETKALHDIDDALRNGGSIGQSGADRLLRAMALAKAVSGVTRERTPEELGAAKRYKIPDGKGAEKALGRLRVEIETLRKNEEPSLLRLIDGDAAQRWMITEYHQKETLAHHRDLFKGQPTKALIAFRDLLRGVIALHDAGIVHRDVKPENIFVADDGRLVLGDFGIVFVEGDARGRLTETFEKVGTSDWMAPWARLGGPIDDVKPSFDVFPLAKVLWSMLSGQPVLPFWYFKLEGYERFDLTKLFPKISAMHLINERILSATVVQHEKDCLKNAAELLERVEDVLDAVAADGQLLSRTGMRCLVCGRGEYKLQFAKDSDHLRMLSVSRLPEAQYAPQIHQMLADGQWITVRVHTCDQCGHVALFQFADRVTPPGWKGRA